MLDLFTSSSLADSFQFCVAIHIIHGFIFYGLGRWLLPRQPLWVALALAIGIEAAWEILENSPIIIDRYREVTMAFGYSGDSILNSVSDALFMILGFLAAIFGGWLGGLLAPSHVVAAVTPVRPVPARPAPLARMTERREVVSERPRRILPAFGRKGGERVETDEVHTTRVQETVQDRS